MFGPMFSFQGCVKGACAVFVLMGVLFHSVKVGAAFAAVPAFFALVALMGG